MGLGPLFYRTVGDSRCRCSYSHHSFQEEMKLNCDTIIVDGVLHEYTYTENNVHIEDSCTVGKKDMEGALLAIQIAHPELAVWQRSIKSLKREWATHNLCYMLGLWRSRTKDVDLNQPNRWEWLYNITGAVALLIVK